MAKSNTEKNLKPGKLVKIKLSPKPDNRVTDGMRKYDGEIHAIKKTHKHFWITNQGLPQSDTTYELNNVVSDEGVPYTFMKDMIKVVS